MQEPGACSALLLRKGRVGLADQADCHPLGPEGNRRRQLRLGVRGFGTTVAIGAAGTNV